MRNDGNPSSYIWHGRSSGMACQVVLAQRRNVEVHCEEVGAIEMTWEGVESLFVCPAHYRKSRSAGEPSVEELAALGRWDRK